ncbi:flavin reductase family protein [bacterium BMS3Abin03]|nr:flavin reductase family protein [bacterium BMS3Abin03]
MIPKDFQKLKMGVQPFLNPKPVVLVGTVIDDKPNFLTVSWTGITSSNPPTMSVSIRNIRYSLKGIQENKTFSVNIPSVKMVKETDYCGSVSGSKYDKVKECEFKIFYGNLDNAPLIEQCPINIECKVFQTIVIGDHSIIIGEIIESYINENCFTKDLPDIKKIDPMCFCTLTTKAMGYYKLGDFIAGTNSIKKSKTD